MKLTRLMAAGQALQQFAPQLQRAGRVLGPIARAAWTWLRAQVGARELVQTAGLALIAWGVAQTLTPPAGAIAFGAGLFYLSVWHSIIAQRTLRG